MIFIDKLKIVIYFLGFIIIIIIIMIIMIGYMCLGETEAEGAFGDTDWFFFCFVVEFQ